MPRKVISIIFYVIAGFLLYIVGLLAFLNMSALPSAGEPPAWAKFAIVGGFSVPAIIALVIGLGISRFQHWKRDVGIVMVSGAGTTAFVVFGVACTLLSPESKEFLPRDKLELFSDIVTGVICMALIVVLGVALIMISKKSQNQPIVHNHRL